MIHIGFCFEIYITNLEDMQFHKERKEITRKGTEDMTSMKLKLKKKKGKDKQ